MSERYRNPVFRSVSRSWVRKRGFVFGECARDRERMGIWVKEGDIFKDLGDFGRVSRRGWGALDCLGGKMVMVRSPDSLVRKESESGVLML